MVEVRLRRQQYSHVPHLEPERGDPGANRFGVLRHPGINQDVPGRRGDQIRGEVHGADVVDVVDDVDRLGASGPGVGDGDRLGCRRALGRTADTPARSADNLCILEIVLPVGRVCNPMRGTIAAPPQADRSFRLQAEEH